MRLTRRSVDLPQPDRPIKGGDLAIVEGQADVLQRRRIPGSRVQRPRIEIFSGKPPSRRVTGGVVVASVISEPLFGRTCAP